MSVLLKKLQGFEDERGKIEHLVDLPFGSVLRITSKSGTRRADHFHKEDYHVCILTDGKMNYYERPVGSNEKPELTEINKGDIFITYQNKEHCMEFTEDSEFWCFSKLSREQENYEADTVRIPYSLALLYKNWEKLQSTDG
jgi:quercetin dioxygenase-like cupin family protein